LRPFGAKVFAQPFTPERILAALGKVPTRWPEPAQAPSPTMSPAKKGVLADTAPATPVGFLSRLLRRT